MPTSTFTANGIDESKLKNKTVTETKFRSAYTEARYTAPTVMIRELDSLPCVFRRRGFLAYKANIVGISAPLSGEEELRRFYDKFSEYRNVLRPLCLLLGSQALLGKSTVPMKRDFDALPWPENENDLKLSFWENALCDDIIDYFAEYVRRGQNSHLLREAVLPAQLKKYSDLFVKMLGSVYSNFHQSF